MCSALHLLYLDRRFLLVFLCCVLLSSSMAPFSFGACFNGMLVLSLQQAAVAAWAAAFGAWCRSQSGHISALRRGQCPSSGLQSLERAFSWLRSGRLGESLLLWIMWVLQVADWIGLSDYCVLTKNARCDETIKYLSNTNMSANKWIACDACLGGNHDLQQQHDIITWKD